MRLVLIFVACAAAVFGQRHKIEEVNAEKPEGKLLQQIMQENDAAKKTALLDQFGGEFPKHEPRRWVLEQLQGVYVKANEPDKVISAGDKLLALDPDDPEAALQCLKAAETKKDVAAIKKYATMTWANAPARWRRRRSRRRRRRLRVEGAGGLRQAGGAVRGIRALQGGIGVARPQGDDRTGRGAARAQSRRESTGSRCRSRCSWPTGRRATTTRRWRWPSRRWRAARATKTCCWCWPTVPGAEKGAREGTRLLGEDRGA